MNAPDLETIEAIIDNPEKVARQIEDSNPKLAQRLRIYGTPLSVRRERAARDWRIMNGMDIPVDDRERMITELHGISGNEAQRIRAGKDTDVITQGRRQVAEMTKSGDLIAVCTFLQRKHAELFSPNFTGKSP